MAEVGGEIKRRRDELDWSQPQLAVRAGVAVSAVSQIENGRRSPNVGTLEKIAGALGVEVADLFPKVRAPLPESSEERRKGPWMSDVLASLLDTWERQVRERENPYQSRTIAIAALDIQDAVTFNYKPEWDALPQEEKMARHALAKWLDMLVLDAFDHYKQAKKAEAEEVKAIQRRREEIRHRTREISA